MRRTCFPRGYAHNSDVARYLYERATGLQGPKDRRIVSLYRSWMILWIARVFSDYAEFPFSIDETSAARILGKVADLNLKRKFWETADNKTKKALLDLISDSDSIEKTILPEARNARKKLEGLLVDKVIP